MFLWLKDNLAAKRPVFVDRVVFLQLMGIGCLTQWHRLAD